MPYAGIFWGEKGGKDPKELGFRNTGKLGFFV